MNNTTIPIAYPLIHGREYISQNPTLCMAIEEIDMPITINRQEIQTSPRRIIMITFYVIFGIFLFLFFWVFS